MRARTVGPALMIALGGAMMFMPTSTYVGAGSVVVTDPCQIPSDNVQGLVAAPPPTDCCIVEGPAIVGPCIEDTTPDTVVDTSPDTTELAESGGQIPATGTSSNTWLVVLLGGALVLSGSGLLVAGRRRPSEPR